MKPQSTKMKKSLPPLRLRSSAGFIVLLAVIYFFDDEGLLAALLPAVMIHELAHLAALLYFGAPPRAISATLSGLAMDYSGELSLKGEITTALSGPTAGILLAWGCALLGKRFESEYLLLSAGIGFIINAFNLLPAPQLDGGRALAALLRHFFGPRLEKRVMLTLGIMIALSLVVCGVFFFARGMGFAMIPAGIWVLVCAKNQYL